MALTPRIGLAALLVLLGCGGSTATSSGDRATEEVRESNEAAPSAPPSAETIASLIAELEQGDALQPFHGIDSVRTTCGMAPPDPNAEDDEAEEDEAIADWYEVCELQHSAAYDEESHRWIVLDVDHSEGGPERFSLIRASTEDAQVILQADFGPTEIAALREHTARFASLATPENRMSGRRVYREHSLNTYAPLVELAAPLDGWLLYLETGTDLDRPEYALYLVGASGSPVHELARRPARTGPIDGDGYFCTTPVEHDCDEAGLRAEGRLGINPLGITQVAIGPDRTILIQGFESVAGHGGYPAFHWVAQVPAEITIP